MTAYLLLPPLLLALLLPACSNSSKGSRPGTPNTNDTGRGTGAADGGRSGSVLVGTAWRLAAYETRAKGTTVGDPRTARTTLLFTDSANCGGNTGCNRFGGTYRADSPAVGQISFGPMITTKMYCEDVGAFEGMYTSTFTSPLAYRLTADSLHLTVLTPQSDSAIAALHFVRK